MLDGLNIDRTQKLVNNKDTNFKIDKINYEDQKVFDLLSSGKTVGLFQLESSGMKDALINMKPNHIEDIIALVALYRQGPMNNILHQLTGGLRASLGYTGCADLDQMRSQCQFVRITQAGVHESHVHDVSVVKESPNYQRGD